MKKKELVDTARKHLVPIIIVVISVALVASIAVRLYKSNLFRKAAPPKVVKIPVVVAPVTKGEILDTLTFPADLHAEREATLYTDGVNAWVIRYNYREGDEVVKGAGIVTLDRQEKWNKYMPLIVYTPIPGRVAQIYVEPGGYVTPETPLCLIVEGKTIRAVLSVPDPDIRMIRTLMEATLSVSTIPGKTFSGTVRHVTPFIAPGSRAGEVEVFFENNDSALLSGMSGDVTIILDRKEGAIIIPYSAVLYAEEGEQSPYVFTVTNNRAVKKSITLGVQEQKRMEVVTGLAEGERVVTLGKENLNDGSPVIVTETR